MLVVGDNSCNQESNIDCSIRYERREAEFESFPHLCVSYLDHFPYNSYVALSIDECIGEKEAFLNSSYEFVKVRSALKGLENVHKVRSYFLSYGCNLLIFQAKLEGKLCKLIFYVLKREHLGVLFNLRSQSFSKSPKSFLIVLNLSELP
jgi:hypothetical protein